MINIRLLLLLAFTINISASHTGVPGPRDCFWSLGPHSGDPYINLAYPDSNVYYWASVFTMPEGSELYIDGEYPYSRYMSIISYNARGKPLESLADYLIEPQKTSLNPFVSGNQRLNKNRDYNIQVFNKEPVTNRETGMISNLSSNNELNAPSYGPKQQLIIYRIYLPDNSTEPLGGVDLPKPTVLIDGVSYTGKAACDVLNTDQNLAITIDAAGYQL